MPSVVDTHWLSTSAKRIALSICPLTQVRDGYCPKASVARSAPAQAEHALSLRFSAASHGSRYLGAGAVASWGAADPWVRSAEADTSTGAHRVVFTRSSIYCLVLRCWENTDARPG